MSASVTVKPSRLASCIFERLVDQLVGRGLLAPPRCSSFISASRCAICTSVIAAPLTVTLTVAASAGAAASSSVKPTSDGAQIRDASSYLPVCGSPSGFLVENYG